VIVTPINCNAVKIQAFSRGMSNCLVRLWNVGPSMVPEMPSTIKEALHTYVAKRSRFIQYSREHPVATRKILHYNAQTR
jgi:hypothetical protein